jgi:hypothetical protein
LLCFYDCDTVTQILAETLPYGLLHNKQDGDNIKIDGPVLASFRQYVLAIATEEDANTLREELLRHMENKQAQVSGASLREIVSSDLLLAGDLPCSIGLVKWTITSVHKRCHECYPTRSLRAWALAFVLSELGFQVSASTLAVNSKEQYVLQVSDNSLRSGHPDVILVTASVGETDLMAPAPTRINVTAALKPRVIPIRSIPWIAFRRLAGKSSKVTTRYLSDVWEYTFDHTTRVTEIPRLQGGRVRIKLLIKNEHLCTEHKTLVRIWSLHLERLISAPISQFIPYHEGVAATVDACRHDILSVGGRHQDTLQNGGEALDIWYTMTSIMMATVFALCCKSLRQDGITAGAHTQIAFPPDLIFGRKLYDWAEIAGQAVGGFSSSADWTSMLLEAVAGVVHPTPLDERTTNLMSRSWRVIPEMASSTTNSEKINVSDIFGIQANGVAVVSDFLVNISVNPDALITYHLQQGQLLDLPTDDIGYIRAAVIAAPVRTLSLDSIPHTRILENAPSDAYVRIDVEPSWGSDPRTVVFRARNEGVTVATLSPELVSRKIHYRTVECTCASSMPTVEVASEERWQSITMSQLLEVGGSRITIPSKTMLYVQSNGDEMSQLLCAGALECNKMAIALGCVSCAYNKLKPKTPRVEASLVVVG